MLKIKTTLILGAGASQPFGFPLGGDIRRNILKGMEFEDSPEFKYFKDAGFKPAFIIEFRNALRQSGQTSIDLFLGSKGGQKYIDIGKIAIVSQIWPAEGDSNLFRNNGSDWYDLLFKKVYCNGEVVDTGTYAIVTFNYDRSLEYYLYTTLMRNLEMPGEILSSQLRSIPIVHVYGSFGPLQWQEPNGFQYRSTNEIETVRRACKNIQVLFEGVDDGENVRKARALINKSERIIFLGFGYDETNLKRLDVQNIGNTQIWGTARGFKRAEQDKIKGSFKSGITLDANERLVNEYLRETVLL